MTPAAIAMLIAALLGPLTPIASQDHHARAFMATSEGETFATVRAGCAGCDWGEHGRESVALKVTLDGRYSQHLQLVRGEATVDYHIALGRVGKGLHHLTLDRDPALTASGAGPATIDVPEITFYTPGQSGDYTALSMAPILYARENTVGKFTDLPLLMWYEVVPTAHGRQFRYSVIFSNEDGGTQTDRLMATWGRTTDIEFVYGVEVDGADRVVAEEFQGPGHEVPAFTGTHEGRHPLLWVSTDNNMVSDTGRTTIRYAPMPVAFDLTDQAREAVMDANPWTYAIAAVEMRREGKLAEEPPPGINKIPDPRRFVFVEACGTVGNAALAISVASRRSSGGDLAWSASDRGLPQYRITRDGCFTIATPLPAGTHASDVRAIRVNAFARPAETGGAAVSTDSVHVMRINKVFMLDERFLPGPSILRWEGPASIRAGGDPLEVTIP
ncbi:MAG: hypothetical protein JWL71_1800 [Acidobacteria bacterium]|nr:hypothetical protein [Acidobacteriota bacterium]